MSIAKKAIEKKTITLVLTFVMVVGGLSAYRTLSRLEDPEFTIKEALVITPYPGASAYEVEEEVTDLLEKEIQKLQWVDDRLESKSSRGLSSITVRIDTTVPKKKLPQVWDELRRKVSDVQNKLPPGAGPSIVNDDYGDVWGVFLAITGPEYSYAELKDYVDMLRKELLLVEGVAKIDTLGERKEVVYVELSKDRLAQLRIPEEQIVKQLEQKNLIADAGRLTVGSEFITLSPTGTVTTVKQFESILIGERADQQIYLKDIATVRRGYQDPPSSLIRFDGDVAIGLGISTKSGGNVGGDGRGGCNSDSPNSRSKHR